MIVQDSTQDQLSPKIFPIFSRKIQSNKQVNKDVIELGITGRCVGSYLVRVILQ